MPDIAVFSVGHSGGTITPSVNQPTHHLLLSHLGPTVIGAESDNGILLLDVPTEPTWAGAGSALIGRTLDDAADRIVSNGVLLFGDPFRYRTYTALASIDSPKVLANRGPVHLQTDRQECGIGSEVDVLVRW